MNVTYYFSTSDVDPLKSGNDRITELAKLRNIVMDPLVRQPELYHPDTTVIFLNDVSICTDDILELVYQKVGYNIIESEAVRLTTLARSLRKQT